jgi:hypothetical protein
MSELRALRGRRDDGKAAQKVAVDMVFARRLGMRFKCAFFLAVSSYFHSFLAKISKIIIPGPLSPEFFLLVCLTGLLVGMISREAQLICSISRRCATFLFFI